MNGLYDAALEVQQYFDDLGWRFCIIGGLAVVRWGRPRATLDVDVSLLTDLGSESDFVTRMLAKFAARIPDAEGFAIKNRVVLLSASNGVALDVSLSAFPFEVRMIERATPFEFHEGVRLVTASAEDLIVLKAVAGRGQDWVDVEGIVIRQGKSLDWDTIVMELEALCELMADRGCLERLDQLRRRDDGN